ncbi:hypothetical protein SNF32_02340 [Enterococcus mundtii]|nr:hypothetical protein [Enterococcus mundtii]
MYNDSGVSLMELQFPLHNDTSRKIIHIDMDAFSRPLKNEITLNFVENP